MSTSVFLRHSSPGPLPQSYQGGFVIDLFAEPQRSTLATNFDAFLATVGQPSPLGLDFLFLSSGLYVADKKTPRRLAPDRWTRTSKVRASATDPTLWMAATPHLREAVSLLTGDQWTFQWRAEPFSEM
jgi:hypothetical protein